MSGDSDAEECYVSKQVSFGVQNCVSERGTAAVIDGAKLLVTPLRLAIVPPPLSAVALLAPAPVSCVAIRDFAEAEVHPCLPVSCKGFQQLDGTLHRFIVRQDW